MSGPLMRIFFTFVLGIIMIFVPREKYQKKLDGLPDMAHKADGYDLHGWEYQKIQSPVSGMTHYYYHFPNADFAAPTLIMLHGFNTDGRVFLALKDLSAKFNLIAYNFPEESPVYNGHFEDFDTLLDDFCRTMRLSSICLAGNSVGGAIALCYAANAETVKVHRLLLVSSEIFGATPDDRIRSRRMADKLLPLPDYKLYYLLDRSRALLRSLEKAGYGEDAPQEILMVRRIGWYRQILSALRNYDGSTIAGKITCPVVAFHGAKDRVIPLENARLVKKLIPKAYFEVMPDRGHAMIYTDGPAVAAKLLSLCGQME